MLNKKKLLKAVVVLFALLVVAGISVAIAQPPDSGTSPPPTLFNLSEWFAKLLAEGGVVVFIVGWVKKLLPSLDGLWAQLASWVVAGLVAVGASLVGFIPVEIGTVGSFLLQSFVSGILANIMYKLEILKPIAVRL
jgi:hypothetical protein